MRPLEISLLATLILGIVFLWWPDYGRGAGTRRAAVWPAIIASALAIAHVAFEGWRWQMVPAYGLVVAEVLATLWRPRRERPRRWIAALIMVAGLVWWLVAAALPALLPVPRLPEPTGPYAVGTRLAFLVDAERSDPFSDPPGQSRQLVMQVWYPADPEEIGDTAPYLGDLDRLAPVLSERLSFPAFFLQHISLVRTHALVEAPLAADGAPYPVLVFSHGISSFRAQSTYLMEELASQGYVVAAVDHTYGATATVFPDGEVVLYNPDVFDDSSPEALASSRTRLVRQWAADIGLELDTLAEWNEAEPGDQFTGQLALDRAGILGHSTGAGATVEFCASDARCRAALLLDGWFEPVSASALSRPLPAPLMLIQQPGGLGNQANKARMQSLFSAAPLAGYRVEIEGTGHFNFADIPLLSPITAQLGLTGPIDGRRGLSIVRAYGLAFFDTWLKERPAPELMDPSLAPPYPEVNFAARP